MTFGNQWGGTILGAVTNSLFPSNNTTQQPSAQSFASQQKEQWVNPMEQVKMDPGFWDAYDKAPDGQKSLMQTLAFMGPLSLMSERVSDRQEAAANRLLDKQFDLAGKGFERSLAGALQRDTLKGAFAMVSQPSLIPYPTDIMRNPGQISGPMG